ncbi:glycosyltransferase family 4 protein [Chloroflexota bacterium]
MRRSSLKTDMNKAVRSRNICLTSPQYLPYAQNILSKKFPGEDIQLMTLTLAGNVRGLLAHNFRRYDKAIFCTYDLDVQIFPLPLMLIILWLSRKGAYFIDMQGRMEQIRYHTLFYRHLPSIFVEIASALFVILRTKRDIRRLKKSILPRKEHRSKESENKLKIAYLRTEHSFGTISGGSVAHIQGVVEGFSASGYSLFFISTDKLVLADRKTPLYIIKPRGVLRNLPNLLEMEYSRYLVKKASEIFEEEQPTMIYQRNSLNNYAGAILANKFNLPLILEYNSPLIWMARHWGKRRSFERIADDIELLNLRAANLIVVVSKSLREYLIARGLPEAKILVNPNGVNPERFRPDIDSSKIRHRYGLEERIVVGFIGTFGKWHGSEILAKAAVKIINEPSIKRQIHLLFIGDGAMLPETKRIVQEGSIKDRVTFTGMVPQAQAAEHLAACDILVCPTLPNPDGTEFFGSPTKLFEYMAMGKGIVASKVGQIGEILSHEETAILTEPGNIERLAAGILRLVENKELREQLGKRAIAVVTNKYTWEQNVARVIKALKDLGVMS